MNDLDELVSRWADQYQVDGAALTVQIRALLGQGMPIKAAIDQALTITGFTGKMADALRVSIGQGAGIGFGAVSLDRNQALQLAAKLEAKPWAPDRLKLSDRLHGLDQDLRRVIRQDVSGAIKQGTKVYDLARKLYDGYGYPETIKRAQLPDYLDKLTRAAKGLDPVTAREMDRIKKQAIRQINRLQQNGAPTMALKSSYQQLYNAAVSGKQKAIDKALDVAVNEKSRYHAERIARTEMSRAYSEGFWAKNYVDPLVVAVKWQLSSRHPNLDICDFHKNANLYGLGAGVYPKTSNPPHPAHPHCTCRLRPVYEGDAGNPAPNVENGGDDYLKSLTGGQRAKLLTKNGAAAWEKGRSWKKELRNWQGHSNPDPVLTAKDFPAPIPAAAPAPPTSMLKQQIDAIKAAGIKSDADLIQVGALLDAEIVKNAKLIAATEAEALAKALKDRLEAEYNMTHASPSMSADDIRAAREAYWNAANKHVDAREAVTEANTQALASALAQVREIGAKTPQLWEKGSSLEIKKLFGEAAAWLPTDWLEESAKTPMFAKKVNRGHYQHSAYGASEFYIRGNNKDQLLAAIVHEFGHRVERVVADVLKREGDIYARRTAGEAMQWLGSGYGRNEVSRFDKWTNAYIGKDYGGRAYEVVSMGLEGVIRNKWELGVNAKDKDLRQFILGVLGAM